MDPLELAKSIEKSGIDYYEKLVAETPMKELRSIFAILAKEEKRHFELFDAMQKQLPQSPLQPGTSGAEAKTIFESLTKQFSLPEVPYDYTLAYSKAREMEQKSIALYEGMLKNATSAEEKNIFSFLIAEEQKHEHLLDHIIDFVNQPNVFLETAEFNHLLEG